MNYSYKDIFIGELIRLKVEEFEMETDRICRFFDCDPVEISNMYIQNHLSTEVVLKWSKLLKYDFFRIYTQHLILYSPVAKVQKSSQKPEEVSQIPKFRKNIYTVEVIDFILELIKNGKKTKTEIICDYNIPKTTLYKWISKYS